MMKIGIIAEGHSDRAVITNILTGFTGIDRNDIEPLLPIYNLDETDKAIIDPRTFSTWSAVKSECEKRELIDGFFALEGNDFVVIHIDTAEADQYGVARPNKKTDGYCDELRTLVIQRINSWLQEDMSKKILYAVAIEETDAWILTIYDQNDSTTAAKAKEKLGRVLSKKEINSSQTYENYLYISKAFSKEKIVKKGKFLTYNCSLKAFCDEVEAKVIPALKNEQSD